MKTSRFLKTAMAIMFCSLCISACAFLPDGEQCETTADCPLGQQCQDGRFCYTVSTQPEPKGGTEKVASDVQPETTEPDAGGQEKSNEPLQPDTPPDSPPDTMPDKTVPEDTPEPQKDEGPTPEGDPCNKFSNIGQNCNTQLSGACSEGKYVCKDGSLVCIPNIQPGTQPEVCDGIDNNCDGSVDENLGQESCGTGPCRITINKCKDGKVQTCTPKQGSTEICNGIDDDCDGMADEGVSNCCTPGERKACGSSTGECVQGYQECDQNRSWGNCIGQTLPTNEICNGKDDDCNGSIDDTNFGMISCGTVGTPCFNQVQTCVNGQVQACTPKPPQTEVCNGKDDDCDGMADNVNPNLLQNDPKNCGKCGLKCATYNNMASTCEKGVCKYTCNGDWRNLDGSLSNGCEIQRNPSINDTKIVLHFDCEKISMNTIISDKSGSANHGAVTGVTISTAQSLFGKSCYFGGQGKSILVSNSTSLRTAKTIMFWSYPIEFKLRQAALYWSDDSPVITFQSGKWNHIFNNKGTAINIGPTPSSKWTHHAIVYGPNNTCSYIDGTPIGCQTNVFTGSNLYLGGDPGSSTALPDRYFRGYLDEIVLSAKVYTPTEITRYYDQTRP